MLALQAQLTELRTIFRPASPIDDPRIFRGRQDQLRQVSAALEEIGRHAVIFGERGVGKTSLAYMATDLFHRRSMGHGIALRIQCTANDSFGSLWASLPHLLESLEEDQHETGPITPEMVARAHVDLTFGSVKPESVGRALQRISRLASVLIIIDEFDRIPATSASHEFADLIKFLSDNLIDVTVLLIGVADNLEQLIQGHSSVDRGLRQIRMPRMSTGEVRQIVEQGFEAFGERTGTTIVIERDATRAIVNLSEGFPYYAHLLAASLGELVLIDGRDRIDVNDVFRALLTVTNEASQSIRMSYSDAISSNRKGATFDLSLLACALADHDQLGFFTARDVAVSLSVLLKEPRTSAQAATHLRRFSQAPAVLESRGKSQRRRYRFSNPLMKPFVIMEAVRTGRCELPSVN